MMEFLYVIKHVNKLEGGTSRIIARGIPLVTIHATRNLHTTRKRSTTSKCVQFLHVECSNNRTCSLSYNQSGHLLYNAPYKEGLTR